MPLSLLKNTGTVGLDIGHHTLKAVQVERHAGVWRVSKLAEAPTPPEAVRDGVVVDQTSLAEAIRALVREGQFGAMSANIAVAGGPVTVRVIQVPKMNEAALRKSIRYEASRYVPTSVDESYIEFETIGVTEAGQMEVLVVAAPRDVVESRVRACEAAGLEVEVVEVEAFSAYRALVEANQLESWADSVVAMVDIGATATNVSVVERGTFAMTRTIPQGSQAMTDALASHFKLTPENAESGKCQLDIGQILDGASAKDNPPLKTIQPLIDELVREVRRSLNYYQSQQTEGSQANSITSVLLTGGGANLSGLDRYFQHKLSLPTSAVGLFDNPAFESHISTRKGHSLSVACGLAMRAHAKAA